MLHGEHFLDCSGVSFISVLVTMSDFDCTRYGCPV